MQATMISIEIASRSKRERSRIRRAAPAGIIGPLWFSTIFLAQQAFRRAEYDPIAEPVGALEAGPYGWVQQINFLVFAALLRFFATGLHRGIDRTRHGILGPAFLGVASIGLLGIVWPIAPAGTRRACQHVPATTSGASERLTHWAKPGP
jgi:Protein of unknown function (DUF998)